MKNKIISLMLAVLTLFSCGALLSGCGNDEYPVEVANIVIEKEPENIVVLDASTADIISYMGYDVKMVGRSDEVNQEWMSVVPSVGFANKPDVKKIEDSGADLVFAGVDLDDSIKTQLQEAGIQVVTISQAETAKEVEVNYVTVGKIIGGNVSGSNEGSNAYNNLINQLDTLKTSAMAGVSADTLYTTCYLYYEDNTLKLMTSGTYGDMLLGYTGAVNAAVNIEETKVDVSILKVANPNFIFYADDATLNAIKSDSTLKNLSAVKSNKTCMITRDEMNRQGQTALNTLDKMLSFIYPEYSEKNHTSTAATQAATQGATDATSAANGQSSQTETTAATSLDSQYKINLDKLSLEYKQENDNVKIMQQRLYDLGYVTDKENITGYYGDVTKEAVSQFQKANGIKETGTADNATLKKMFMSDAEKAE